MMMTNHKKDLRLINGTLKNTKRTSLKYTKKQPGKPAVFIWTLGV